MQLSGTSKPNVKQLMHGICSDTSRNSFRTEKFYPIRRNERPASVSERTVDLSVSFSRTTSSSRRACGLAGRVHETPGPDGGKAIQRGLRICSTVTVTGCGLQFLATSSRCVRQVRRSGPSETSFLQRILSPAAAQEAGQNGMAAMHNLQIAKR